MSFTEEEESRIAGLEQQLITKDEQVAAILENLQTVTDNTGKLDKLIAGGEFMYFQCLHSGKYFPADYVKQWGKKYGIGLGRDVVSECLDTNYNIEPSLYKIRDVKQIMHPCYVSRAPLDVSFLVQKPKEEDLLIPTYMDRFGDKRAAIMRANQLNNSNNRIKAYLAKADSLLAQGAA